PQGVAQSPLHCRAEPPPRARSAALAPLRILPDSCPICSSGVITPPLRASTVQNPARRMICTRRQERLGAALKNTLPCNLHPGCMTPAMSGRDLPSFVLQTLSPVQVTGVPPSDHPVPEYRPAPADQQGNPSPAGRNDGAGAGPRVLLVAPQPFFALRGTPMN